MGKCVGGGETFTSPGTGPTRAFALSDGTLAAVSVAVRQLFVGTGRASFDLRRGGGGGGGVPAGVEGGVGRGPTQGMTNRTGRREAS